MASLKDVSMMDFWSNDSDDSPDSEEENLPIKTSKKDDTKALDNESFCSDFEDHLSTQTSDDDSSWVRIVDHNLDTDFQEDLSAKTSDGESSWVKILDHNVDSDFREDHLTDYDFKDVPLKSASLKRDTPATPFDVEDNLARYDKMVTQFSPILDLKEDKSHVEHSFAKGPTHSCNFDYLSSKKLKYLKVDKGLEDLIKMHALPFLPAKSLCRFRSVSKDWDKWISNPFLAHEQTNKFKDISGLLCQSSSLSSSFVLFNRDAYGLPSPYFSFLPVLVKVKSTCNGLVCCQSFFQANVYYVCNPVTKKWTELPEPKLPHESQTIATLAFEPSPLNFAPHYQLVCAVADVLSDNPVVFFEIYSSRTNTWRVAEMVCYEADALTLSSDGFYMKDSVYWKTLSGAMLIFHVKNEMYSIVQLPPNHGPQGALSFLHGEVCYVLPVIHDDNCIISIYGGFDMSLKYEISLPQTISEVYCQALPSLNDEMLIILLEKKVIAYHVRAKKVEILSKERMEGCEIVLPYVNTLVEVATPSPELETVPY